MKKIEKRKKLWGILVLVILIAFSAFISIFIGIPLVRFANEPEKFRALISGFDIWGYFIYVGILLFQIIFAFVPGEPFEILAGYTFGAIEGTLLCLISSLIGCSIVFYFSRKFGLKFVRLFFSDEKIKSLKILNDKKKMYYITFLAFFIPGTPKDLLSYVAGLTPIKFVPYIILTTVAKIPSILTSTIGGEAIGDKQYYFAIIVFAATALLCLLGIFIYNKITKK